MVLRAEPIREVSPWVYQRMWRSGCVRGEREGRKVGCKGVDFVEPFPHFSLASCCRCPASQPLTRVEVRVQLPALLQVQHTPQVVGSGVGPQQLVVGEARTRRHHRAAAQHAVVAH